MCIGTDDPEMVKQMIFETKREENEKIPAPIHDRQVGAENCQATFQASVLAPSRPPCLMARKKRCPTQPPALVDFGGVLSAPWQQKISCVMQIQRLREKENLPLPEVFALRGSALGFMIP